MKHAPIGTLGSSIDPQFELDAVDFAELSVVDEAMRILELPKSVLSNSCWVDGKLEVELHEFSDMMLNLLKTASQT